MAKQRFKALSDLEVRFVFEPARISKHLMELAYEALLPIQRRQLQSAISQVDQSQLKPKQRTRDKKEVA